ncbi:thiopeptide-type bacteriocin biosynthesis protein [Stackebrandtia albiflava]|uniref:Thiopeptide-type bacteriocin biosynthesis protein n=1 Tax=Stackebrandtia albiflava TaxID=406432 RepID=A0A562UQ13_9ACTN|nr:thiopeptide-type bacteriocin biosynthesis protein [Stackebrandtia albiflava]TWJ07712.1 thiopeptide-type bacteriocin biosynthesis protein [Stackebrandtia albiflava]
MPSTHLNRSSASSALASAIQRLSAGADPRQLADSLNIPEEHLAAAAEAYHAAGLAALDDRTDRSWYQAHIEWADWSEADKIATSELLPIMTKLEAAEAITAWWFIRKHPHWRFRIAPTPAHTESVRIRLEETLVNLLNTGHTTAWFATRYEPETAAFGGRTGMAIAHRLFTTDCRHILQPSHPAAALGIRETSLLLCNSLHEGAGLDWYERGDVWRRVAELRPLDPAITGQQLEKLSHDVKSLLRTGAAALRLPHLTSWATAFYNTGNDLSEAATTGELHRGLRATMAHHVIFHWNRLGLPAHVQALLSHTAAMAILQDD